MIIKKKPKFNNHENDENVKILTLRRGLAALSTGFTLKGPVCELQEHLVVRKCFANNSDK